MTYYKNKRLSTIEKAELYLAGKYEFPLLRYEPKNPSPIYADPKILRKLRQTTDSDLFLSERFPLFASQRTYELSQAVLNALADDEEPDSDEVLRQEGFYDSTDPRCCINRSRR